MQRTISIKEIKELENKGVSTFMRKNNSVRGVECINSDNVQIGDEIVINNYFTLVTE